MKREFAFTYKTGTGKPLRIVVKAIDSGTARRLCQKELSKKFKNKTYSKISGPEEVPSHS